MSPIKTPVLRWIAILVALACLAPAGAAPAPAPAADPPATLDPIEVSAEKRAELAFRAIQIALERGRSDRVEDLDLVVCIRQAPTGSHRPVINCATNRKWMQIRAASMAGGLAGLEANGGVGGNQMHRFMAQSTGALIGTSGLSSVAGFGDNGAAKRDDDKVVTLSQTEFNKLKARFGALPPELKPGAQPPPAPAATPVTTPPPAPTG